MVRLEVKGEGEGGIQDTGGEMKEGHREKEELA